MTARAASSAAWAEEQSLCASSGTLRSNGASGSSAPMTPVDATSTSWGLHPTARATSSHSASAQRRPGSPVAAFAMPELRTMARAAPPAACLRLTCTGAAQKRFCVNVAAQTLPSSATTRARSPLAGSCLKPACMPAARMPAAAHTPPSQGSNPYADGSPFPLGTASGSMVPI